jgi:hypothetical protein
VVEVTKSVEVATATVVESLVAGLTVETVVEVPMFRKLPQKEVAGASNTEMTARTSSTAWHAEPNHRSSRSGGPSRRRRAGEGLADAWKAFRNKRPIVMNRGAISKEL